MTTTPAGEQLHLLAVNPADLAVRDQVRADATPDEQLIESVRRHGIQQPPTVAWDPDQGRYVIVFGHRRVGAAIAAGLTEIHVIVRDQAAADQALTLEQQLVENERRKGLSPAEVARGWADLETMFGLTPEQIAEQLAENPDRVRAGIRAARSETTRTLMTARPAIDLERAAVLTEFDDHPDIQAQLADVAVSRSEDFEWRVRNARAKIEKDTKVAVLKAELKAEGVKLANTDSYGTLKRPARPLSALVDERGKKLTPKRHASCPGHRGRVEGWAVTDLKIEYVCADPAEHGHREASSVPRELTDEEKQAQQEARERDEALAANRAARRQWIHDMLPGRINQLPGVYEYMAAALLTSVGYYSDHRAPQWTLPLLGIDTTGATSDVAATSRLDELIASRRVAPFRLLLACALGFHEQRVERGHESAAILRHFERLAQWGYRLTELDQDAVDVHRAQLGEQAAAAEASAADEEVATTGEGEE